ncbi:MAG TPA: PorP/SprF family type IX secretion system membrane protein [Bacteroidales bacterium]|nr:PorP/SprF family type IX secretion system membrane protein [Bacteroidales bacterium]HRZ77656.1 PorP/SprF family type IX secretion system membrane protein [Bacteroidales bacterium]
MRRRIQLILFQWLTLTAVPVAQDIHFLHFSGTGPLLSPAEAGQGKGGLRFTLGHRSQWASVTTPFLSNYMTFDASLREGRKGPGIGLGISMQQDEAGDADFGTTGAMFHLALDAALSRTQRIIMGAGAGMMQRRFDREALNFDEQFNGLVYDPDIIPMDLLGEGPLNFVDLSLGVAWIHTLNEREYRRGGLAVHHPHRPLISFLADNEVRLDRRWTAYFMGSWPLGTQWSVMPETRLMSQGPYVEWVVGGWFNRSEAGAFPEELGVDAGVFTRAGDALILALGGDLRAWHAAMSYELNYSGLRRASAWRGGYELNLVYQLGRLAPGLRRNPGCYIL